MKVGEIMTREVWTCAPNDSLASVGRVMADVGCGILPVADASGTVVGIVTDRDICLALAALDRAPSRVKAVHVMRTDVHGCHAGDEVAVALGQMAAFKVRRLPVLDLDGKAIGILSLDDVALHARTVASGEFSGPFAVEVAATLRAVVEPMVPSVQRWNA